jgi:hypothetical protein
MENEFLSIILNYSQNYCRKWMESLTLTYKIFFKSKLRYKNLGYNIQSFYQVTHPDIIQSLFTRETFCGTLLCLCGRNDGYLELRIRNNLKWVK